MEEHITLKNAFLKGDIRTKVSILISGFGNITRGQIVKGLIFLAIQALFWCFFAMFAWKYIKEFATLGTAVRKEQFNEVKGIVEYVQGDNSMKILLYSVISLFVAAATFFIHLVNIKSAYTSQVMVANGKKPAGIVQDLRNLFDKNVHVTMLSLPAIGVLAFTTLPIVFMILIAFTNFDHSHQPPAKLFTWVGLDNFKDLFFPDAANNVSKSKSNAFFGILGWTFIWAIFATFLNYIFGMIVAMMINKKGIRLKGLWRTCFVIPIAVPAFVTLLFMRQALGDIGPINTLIQAWTGGSAIHFLSDPMLAKITVIVVNLWIGIPYTMLITSGILMNIPADLYESANIDGAGAVKQFTKITLPYMLSVTTPYLITAFIANINNFNAIFFLTGGNPVSLDYYQAGKTDLLVTWLYKLTVDRSDYNLASVIGILVFVICGTLSLVTFNLTASAQKEETFG
ncbi:maltose ABC transporter permease [Clostridia bacterium]|nr:maltose ABC transporter permease [Clostridia bacterium]